MNSMYGYKCQYCAGTVHAKKLAMESFKHKKSFIILEDVTIGVCDTCGNRYYSADILHTVHELATGERAAERMTEVPVAHMA
jgi:YgiT-type zinc finger domain-containing protein